MALATLAESLTCFTAFPAPMAADMKMDVTAMQKNAPTQWIKSNFRGGVEVIENKIVTTAVIAVAANIPNAIILTIGVLLPAKL